VKVGILQCDSVLIEYQAEFADYPHMLMQMFAAVTNELEYQVYNVVDNEYPGNLNECDVYITTGSKVSVYDNLAWIDVLKQFICDLDRNQKKLVGICFGHQLVADALNGKTQASAKGWGVGLSKNKITMKKNWMLPSLDALRIIVSHKDQVLELPTGAELLATSEFCPHFMYQMGKHIMCVQGHPEFSFDYSATLMTHRRKLLGESVYQAGINSLQLKSDARVFAQWIVQFFKN